MHTTRPSLLVEAGNPEAKEARERLARIYVPLIIDYCRTHRKLSEEVAMDVAIAVMMKILAMLATLQYDPAKGGFRGYLYKTTMSVFCDIMRERQKHHKGEAALREAFANRGSESLVEVREHTTNSPWRAREGGEEDAAKAVSDAQEPKAWIDGFQLRLFEEAIQQLREEKGGLSERDVRVVKLAYDAPTECPELAMKVENLPREQEAVIRTKAYKKIKRRMMELGEDEPLLQM